MSLSIHPTAFHLPHFTVDISGARAFAHRIWTNFEQSRTAKAHREASRILVQFDDQTLIDAGLSSEKIALLRGGH